MKPCLELPHASPTDARFMPCKKPTGRLPRVETFLPLAGGPFILCPVSIPFRCGSSWHPACSPGVLDEGDSPPGGPAGRGDADRVSNAARARRRAAAVRPNGDLATRFNRRDSLERMRSLRAWRVISELKLDEAASARVLPIFARYDEHDLALLAERRDINCELRALLAAPRPDDSHISRALDRLAATHSHRRVLHDERLDELRRVLPPVQQARLLLLLPGLERDFAHWGRQAIGDGPQSCDHASRDEAVGRSTSERAARRGHP